MVTKADYEKTFNELLGLDLKWSNLRLEDLIQLAFLFSNPELLIKKLGASDEIQKTEARKRLGDIVIEVADRLHEDLGWEGPIIRALKRLTES